MYEYILWYCARGYFRITIIIIIIIRRKLLHAGTSRTTNNVVSCTDDPRSVHRNL